MKRRILCFVLTMAMVLSMLVVLPAATVSADTYNASDNPVLITTAADLKAFRNAVNGGNTFEGKVVKLCGDIDISDAAWTPIAKNGYAFCGSFDGQGHTITGLYQSYGRFTGDGGLFGFVQVPTTGGTIYIKNLFLTKKGSEKMNSSNGGYCAGTLVSIIAPRSGVAGTVNIENVYSSVDFDSSGSLMTAFGGIVGTISGTTSQRDNNADYASGTSITLNIDSCQYAGNAGSPTAGSTWYGGIFGCNNFVRCNQTVSITNCLVTGEIHIWGSGSLSNYDDNGGIMGYVKGNGGASGCTTTISLCNNIFAGKILWRRDSNQTGGTGDQGFILGEITSGYLNGKVTMTNNYYIVTTPEGGLNVTAGLGGGSGNATITNLTAKTLDEVKALTSSNFTDGSKWYFKTNKVPQPASIYTTFFGTPSIFDDMSQSTFTITTNAEMAEFASLVNEGTTFAGKTIKLGADVNLTTTIGSTDAYPFSGNFNGQGHTVTISQTLSNPDGEGGLFTMVRVPANSTLTIQNVHLAGTISLSNTAGSKGYVGALISCVDAGTSGSGGTLNVTNVWSTTRINANTSNTWYAISSYIGFVRHASGLKPLTINMDSCLWDGVINASPALEYSGAFVGHPGNGGNSGRPLNLNITNSVAAGTIMLNTAYTDDTGLLVGYLKGNGTNSATSVVTANFHDLVTIGKFTSSVNVTKWCSLFQHSGTTTVDLDNFYYVSFDVPGKGTIPVHEGTGTVTGEATVKTKAGIYELTTSDFTTAAKWNIGSTHFPCPQGIVDAFGSVPSTLAITAYDLYDEFEIGTAEALNALATAVNGGKDYEGKTIKITADITIESGWTSIGITSSKPFSGNFNGQGHTIEIHQTLSNPDGVGGLIGFVRTPASGTSTIQNVHVTGRIDATNTNASSGYFGGLIACVDGNTSGSGGTININNVWNSLYINCGNSNMWTGVGGYIGFVRHADGLKSLTVNFDSCVWDGTLNAGPAAYHFGGFVGYTGNNKANRTLVINIENSVAAGKIALNSDWNQYAGLLVGYLRGGYSSDASAKATVNVSNVVSNGTMTFKSGAPGSGSLIGHVGRINDDTTNNEVNFTNLYYNAFDRGVIETPAPALGNGTANTNSNVVAKDTVGFYALGTSAFSNAAKWNKTEGYTVCPAGIVTTFGEVPETLFVDYYDRYNSFSVGTVDEFLTFRDYVNAGKNYSGKTVNLTSDINLLGVEWQEIGRASGTSSIGSKVFKGTFDGHGYTISNMTTVLESTTENKDMQGALFGNLGDGAIVKDFNLTGSMSIKNQYQGTFTYYGSVANAVSGTVLIQDVHSSVNITTRCAKNLETDSWPGGVNYVGGLVGFILHNNSADLTIDGCDYSGTINCANDADGTAGIMAFDGNNSNSSTKNITISNTNFMGRITLNDNGGAYAYEKVGGIFGWLQTGSLTITNTTSAGKVYFNRTKAWTATNISAGQIIGRVDSAADYTIGSDVTYTPIYLYTALPNSDETKFVLGEIGYLNGVYAGNGEDNTDAIIGGMEVIAVAYDEDDGTGIRFIATFFNKAACTGGGSASANFGIFLMSKLVYDALLALGDEAVTYSDVNSLASKNTGAVYKVHAMKYRAESGAYTVNVVVKNVNAATRADGELVAIPYAGDMLGNAATASYSEFFGD